MSLEALERSDLSRLPGGIFTRAFIRAYAQEVGLDPDRTIQDFIAELPPETATTTARHGGIEDGEKLESDRRAVATAMRLGLVSLPLIALVIYFGTRKGPASEVRAPVSGAESQTPAAGPAPAEPAPIGPAAVSANAPAVLPNVSPPQTGLRMEISPKGTCWVSVNADGELAFSGMMRAGDKQVVGAREHIVVNVGDAGAFVYTLNGRPGRPLGAPGDVVTTRITVATLEKFLTP